MSLVWFVEECILCSSFFHVWRQMIPLYAVPIRQYPTPLLLYLPKHSVPWMPANNTPLSSGRMALLSVNDTPIFSGLNSLYLPRTDGGFPPGSSANSVNSLIRISAVDTVTRSEKSKNLLHRITPFNRPHENAWQKFTLFRHSSSKKHKLYFYNGSITCKHD